MSILIFKENDKINHVNLKLDNIDNFRLLWREEHILKATIIRRKKKGIPIFQNKYLIHHVTNYIILFFYLFW
jgi:hypothetical protein